VQISTAEAGGRIVATTLTAPISLPPFRASAMDGFALHSADLAEANASSSPLQLIGTSSAGHPFSVPVPRGCCIRILTGAAVPSDLDAIVIQEDCTYDQETVRACTAVAPGDNIRPIGHDIQAGAVLVTAGTRLNPFHLAWLAACGIDHIQVRRRPRVAIFSTGDELVEPGGQIGPGQIYDANRHALAALLGRLPVEILDLGILADGDDAIATALADAATRCDAIVTSGGVSVGDADRVREAVARVGRISLWRLNLKPGKPLAYGRLGRTLFIGLPGNPVSTIVTALLLVKPSLLKLAGTNAPPPIAMTARLQGTLRHRPGREEYQRGWLERVNGELAVAVVGDQSSNRLSSFAAANCLIRIPKDASDVLAGSSVGVLPFEGLL